MVMVLIVSQGKLSAPRSLLGEYFGASDLRIYAQRLDYPAGLGAGLTEAVFAVTPSETIKSVPTARNLITDSLTKLSL
jgi:hypothetical protein